MTKTCSKCGVEQTLNSFYKVSANSDGLDGRCKECVKKINAEYRHHNRKQLSQKERQRWQEKTSEEKQKINQSSRERRLQRVYGISIQKYNQLLEKQSFCCAICEKHQSKEKNSFAVDHNHFTGEIRGLLCYYCNHRVVGKHRDGILLRKIADYVDQGTGWFVPKKKRPVKRQKGK